MPLVPDNSSSIRQLTPDPSIPAEDFVIEIEEGADKPKTDDAGKILEIEHDDGSVTISLDGRSLGEEEDKGTKGWFDNLADQISEGELSRIAQELLRGVNDDIESRKDWIEDRPLQVLRLRPAVALLPLEGHPAAVMDMSFANQALCVEYLVKTKKLESKKKFN